MLNNTKIGKKLNKIKYHSFNDFSLLLDAA